MWNQEDSLSLTMVGVMCLYWEQKTIQEKFMHLFIFHFAKKLFKNLSKKNSNNVWEREQDLWRKQKLLEKGERGLIYFLLAAYWIMTIIITTIHTPSQLFDLHHNHPEFDPSAFTTFFNSLEGNDFLNSLKGTKLKTSKFFVKRSKFFGCFCASLFPNSCTSTCVRLKFQDWRLPPLPIAKCVTSHLVRILETLPTQPSFSSLPSRYPIISPGSVTLDLHSPLLSPCLHHCSFSKLEQRNTISIN